jgi:hypothetical protein
MFMFNFDLTQDSLAQYYCLGPRDELTFEAIFTVPAGDAALAYDPNTAPERRAVDAPYAWLLSQGATCHINAMLQSLFHHPAFRSLVFQMGTTGAEDRQRPIPLNMQYAFCRL